MSRTFRNPILPGFYPDPSICRAGDDYYLVTSTFEYFPGLPIFHSRDLVHWRQIGHVLDRPSQLPLDGIRPSGGLYAPTIRHHNGVFYVINTLVDGQTQSGNFIVTATDPAGPWSEPYWLENADGFDPSLFFDDDGTVWYTRTRLKANTDFQKGQTEIWLQQLELATMRLVGAQYIIWDGAVKNAVWSESPHLYKIEGRYYLLTAEGGTAHHHAVIVARSETLTGPYEGNRGNPILTHRHLGLDYPIVGAGHADLIDTPNGEWWLVLLAMRPYGGYYYNLGRETFLAPVRWEEGWPIVSAGTGRVEFTYPAPDLPQHDWPTAPERDDFDQSTLAHQWFFLRTPREAFWSLTDRSGWLRLQLRPPHLAELANPSFVGRRQQHDAALRRGRGRAAGEQQHGQQQRRQVGRHQAPPAPGRAGRPVGRRHARRAGPWPQAARGQIAAHDQKRLHRVQGAPVQPAHQVRPDGGHARRQRTVVRQVVPDDELRGDGLAPVDPGFGQAGGRRRAGFSQ